MLNRFTRTGILYGNAFHKHHPSAMLSSPTAPQRYFQTVTMAKQAGTGNIDAARARVIDTRERCLSFVQNALVS